MTYVIILLMSSVEAGGNSRAQEKPKKKLLTRKVVIPAVLVASAAGLAYGINDRINWVNQLEGELRGAGIYEPSDKQIKEAEKVQNDFDKKIEALLDKKDFGAAGEVYSSAGNDKGLAKAQETLKKDMIYNAEWEKAWNERYETRAIVDTMTIYASAIGATGVVMSSFLKAAQRRQEISLQDKSVNLIKEGK